MNNIPAWWYIGFGAALMFLGFQLYLKLSIKFLQKKTMKGIKKDKPMIFFRVKLEKLNIDFIVNEVDLKYMVEFIWSLREENEGDSLKDFEIELVEMTFNEYVKYLSEQPIPDFFK